MLNCGMWNFRPYPFGGLLLFLFCASQHLYEFYVLILFFCFSFDLCEFLFLYFLLLLTFLWLLYFTLKRQYLITLTVKLIAFIPICVPPPFHPFCRIFLYTPMTFTPSTISLCKNWVLVREIILPCPPSTTLGRNATIFFMRLSCACLFCVFDLFVAPDLFPSGIL